MSLNAFHLGQISTVLGQIDHGSQGALAILRCLYGSEMVLLGVVIRRCETPTTNISQENGHGILMITCQIVAAYN